MFELIEILDEAPPTIHIVDVGAAEYGVDPYDAVRRSYPFSVIGFEPHEENCAARNAKASKGHKYLPYFIGDGSQRTFYECNNPLTSSLYPPDAALLDKFNNLEHGIRAVKQHQIQTRRMDDLDEISDIDFLKLDVQGAELDVIKGSPRLLGGAVLVHAEIEFIPMYTGQCLFGDVDVALREHSLWLHKIEGITGRAMKPLIPDNNPNAPMSQWLYADNAIYVKSFMAFDTLPADKLLKLAIILHEVYKSFDLAALALESYDAKASKDVRSKYLQKLVGKSG